MEDNKKVKLKNRRNIKRRKEPKTKDNNKSFIKKKLIIFSIIILIITIILNISITKILLNSKCKNTEKYEVIEDVTSSDTASDIQQTINSNKDYVFSCLPSQLEENDLMINKVIFTFEQSKLPTDINKCIKYEVVCEDENHVNRGCSASNARVIEDYEGNYAHAYAYFEYYIDGKTYIKNFKTNEFVIKPQEYDDITYKNRYIRISKGKKVSLYNCEEKNFMNFEGFEIEQVNLFVNLVILKGKDGMKIRTLEYVDGSPYYLENIKIDKVFATAEDRILVQEGNNIKLYDKYSLLWNYGSFENVNSIYLYEISPSLTQETESYVMSTGEKPDFILMYDNKTKKGEIR